MSLRFVSWIWNVKGSLALPAGQSSDETFGRLMPLFRQTGTIHERAGDTVTFQKKDQAAQDKMSIFDHGVLRIERDTGGHVLRYRLVSRTLLFCFFLPLLFLSFAGLTIALNHFHTPSKEEAAKAHKPAAKKMPDVPMNPIDKALGAPTPEKHKKGDAAKDKDKDQPKPTSAYVFAAIFAVLYVFGRVFEDRWVKGLFRRKVFGA